MDFEPDQFRTDVESLIMQWKQFGLPSRAVLESSASKLLSRRNSCEGKGLWEVPPLMTTATLDDGLGQGLAIIHQFAEAVGMRIRPLGLLQSPEFILAACREETPEFLGMTILQFDSEDDLKHIALGLPHGTRLICGGPVFNADREFAERCGVHFVARDVGVFLQILLTLSEKR